MGRDVVPWGPRHTDLGSIISIPFYFIVREMFILVSNVLYTL